MKNKYVWLAVVSTLCLGVLCGFIMQSDKKTVWMIGDSTMAIKDPDKFPETGWGVPFEHLFKEKLDVINKARNGRSTKSCIGEGTWQEVYNELKPGDYVLIQFGHNDEKIDKPNTGTTIAEYKENLSLFVTETRTKKAHPILLTPIARRAFEEGKLLDTHGAYPDAVRKVADSLDVPFIDLTQQTSALLTEMGAEKSISWFLHLPEGHINYPNGVVDNTHLNEQGAATIADLVAQDIIRQRMPLAKDLKK